ncbi:MULTISPECIES: NAD-dependent epimerase/dehydratase family protein [unclassified Nocardioides]|uniref:NAD-dependent epimerase/dehydratase family protein n=1 Tax=unclassified Nocardioides TaxID=2615069 RepID=UPI0009EFF873|nr:MULTISPECIES: NAD(P)-dependent oxidoreductase [unclassified Nocardioides]GAW50814.1 NAD-dependent epimerase/dehydratase [Nocardioides sp. PD653-B2]GAW52753.1 NAD-dependent epimerase/dehydratase [Nocardioides sp. PD653]
MKVLLSGAAGSIGRALTLGLVDRGHEIVGFDRVPQPEGHVGPWYTGDCADPDAVAEVFDEEHFDAVVHMAGHPGEASLPDSLTSHVVTTAALLDAMVEHDVTRIVYGGSNHAVGRTPRTELLGIDVPPRPDTFYGVSKVAAEALMSLYADRYGIDAVSCRIGSFLERPETVRHLATWLSPDDCVRMVDAALTATAPGFAVLYGISDNTRAWWDLEPGRALGYEPQDDAEDFLSSVRPGPSDEAEAGHVGGPYATAEFERPALDRSS